MQCPLCGVRKARRTCPALGRQICSVCCGTKRLTEIRCPSDCVYLSTAREHPPAVVQRQQQQDLDVLLPALEGLTDVQARLFFLTASVALRFKGDDLRRLIDGDMSEAAGALRATFETAQRGVIYDHRPASLVAERLAAELKAVYAEVGKNVGSRFERDAIAALRAVEKGIRGKPAGASETAYLELLARVVGQDDRSENHAESAPGSRIIIPGSA